jgi:hypothetical protein
MKRKSKVRHPPPSAVVDERKTKGASVAGLTGVGRTWLLGGNQISRYRQQEGPAFENRED